MSHRQLLAALLALALTGCAKAPPTANDASSRSQYESHLHGRDRVLRGLDLTREQLNQIQALKRVKREEREARMKKILTAEQYQKLEQNRAEEVTRLKQRRKWLADELGLTAEQQEKIKQASLARSDELRRLSSKERQVVNRDIMASVLSPAQLAKYDELERSGWLESVHAPGH